MNPQGILGAQQGPQGAAQGFHGAQAAATSGSNTGMQNEPNRQKSGLFSSLAPLVSMIPGWGALAGAGMSAIGGMQDQNAAKKAAQAGQMGQGGALSGMSGIAGQLAGPPDYSGIIKAEESGINTMQRNIGGIANPGAVAADMRGGNIERAISGANADRSANLNSAAGILNQTQSAYSRTGNDAAGAAQAGGNPFQLFANAVSGGGKLGGLGGLAGLFGHGGLKPQEGEPGYSSGATVEQGSTNTSQMGPYSGSASNALTGGMNHPNFGYNSSGMSPAQNAGNSPQAFSGFTG